MSKHYWAVRPIRMPDHIRIERAADPRSACNAAFGRGTKGFEYKDLGPLVAVIQSDTMRRDLLLDPQGWTPFP